MIAIIQEDTGSLDSYEPGQPEGPVKVLYWAVEFRQHENVSGWAMQFYLASPQLNGQQLASLMRCDLCDVPACEKKDSLTASETTIIAETESVNGLTGEHVVLQLWFCCSHLHVPACPSKHEARQCPRLQTQSLHDRLHWQRHCWETGKSAAYV